MTTLEDFAQMFAGRDKNDLSGEGLAQARAWLNKSPNLVEKKAYACIVFSEKPANFLITGKSGREDKQTVKNDGKAALNQAIHAYLPQLEEEPTDPESVKRRREWGNFKNINLSMIRRVAFDVLENGTVLSDHKIVSNWKARWGEKPSRQDPNKPGWVKAAPESRRIRDEQIKLYLAERRMLEERAE